MKPIFLLIILLMISAPAIADKNKGIFSGEVLNDVNLFTSNISDTPGYVSDNQSPVLADVQNTQDWMNIGKTQLKSENWKPAEEVFSKVIDKEPKNTEGWEGYLLAIRGGGNFDKLLEASERATKENPGFASAWKYNGIALSSLEKSEEALTAFDKALQADPKYYTAWYYKGIALNDLKRYDLAVQAFDEVIILNPSNVKAWNNKGVALSNGGRYDEAIAAFDKTLEIDPSFKKASENKARTIEEKGRNSLESADIIDDALSVVPSSLDYSDDGDTVIVTLSPTPTPILSPHITDVISVSTQIPTFVPTPEPQITTIVPTEIQSEESSPEVTSATIIQSSGTKSGANMYHGNPAHTGEYPGPAATKGAMKWKQKLPQIGSTLDKVSMPVISNGIVYVGAQDLYACNAETGEIVWTFEDYSSKLSPSVVDGFVYFGSSDMVYALDAKTGKIVWNFEIGETVGASPPVVNGIVYITSYDDYLYALDSKTGTLIWKFKGNGHLNYSSPAVAKGIVYFTTDVHYEKIDRSLATVYALDAETGSLIWEAGIDEYCGPSYPLVADDIVYVGGWHSISDKEKIYYILTLEAESGSFVKKFEGFNLYTSVVVDGTIYSADLESGRIVALNAITGKIVWENNNAFGYPCVADGIVYVGSKDGVYALGAETGDQMWSYQTGSQCNCGAVLDGTIYVVSEDSYLYAFE